jgi:hypothetical protein
MELDHIEQKGGGGSDNIDNAIPVCFECHAEIHSYNDKHPRGRKFRPEELRGHKKQWLDLCKKHPEIFANIPRDSEVGPLQALIDELEFNLAVTESHSSSLKLGGSFLDEQFRQAIARGVISVLNDELRKAITQTYVKILYFNQTISRALSGERYVLQSAREELRKEVPELKPQIELARTKLLEFLGSEDKQEN